MPRPQFTPKNLLWLMAVVATMSAVGRAVFLYLQENPEQAPRVAVRGGILAMLVAIGLYAAGKLRPNRLHRPPRPR
jgi:hypothetical protein